MIPATCKTCPFWGPMAECRDGKPVEPTQGLCRRHPPRVMMTSSGGDCEEFTTENPSVPDFWFCGEHPARQRDRLAAIAMQGMLAAETEADGLWTPPFKALATRAYAIADAMLAARGEGR